MLKDLEKALVGYQGHIDEYGIYSRLTEWGNKYKSVNHGAGKCARDWDGDGLYEVYVNTIEGL